MSNGNAEAAGWRDRCESGMFLREEARERTTPAAWPEGCLILANRSVWLGPDFPLSP